MILCINASAADCYEQPLQPPYFYTIHSRFSMSRLASTLSTITLASSLVGSSYGLTMPRADVDHSDWKYAVGWDGVTLSSDAIGTAVAPPPTSRDDVYLEVRTHAIFWPPEFTAY